MQRYNRTNFTSSSVAKQLIAAVKEVLIQGHSAYLANRQGKRWMRASVHGENFQGTFHKQTFEFYAGSGQDVGELIFQASFEWPHELQDEFFQLLGELSRLTDHLHNVVAKRVAEAQAKADKEARDNTAAELYILKQAGATHKGTDSLGKPVYLSYKKGWFGFGKTITRIYKVEPGLFGGLQVHSQEVNGEAFTMGGFL